MFMTKTINKSPLLWRNMFDETFKEFDNIFKPLEFSYKENIMVNVVKNKKDYTVEAYLPKIDKDKISIDINDNKLTIKYKNSEEKEDKTYLRREFSSETFSRTVILPNDVDLEKASAEYKDGVLLITAPKTNEKKLKRIEIK